MTDTAIRVQGLSKRYRIGERQRYRTLRESITDTLTGPFRRARRLAGPGAMGGGDAASTFWALKDVSFEVKRGEVVGVIGRNGAGKSTLLKVLSRITEPTEGQIEIHGRVGSLLEVGTGFHPELTGRENIFLNGAILGMRREEIARKFDEIVAFSEIEKFIDTPVKHYSSGMYTRLAFAVAAHLEPEILIVDEVLAVGDAEFQKKCLGKMGEVARGGRTVLFVSHNMAAIGELCETALLLERGALKLSGPASGVLHEYLKVAPKKFASFDRGPLRSVEIVQQGRQIELIAFYQFDRPVRLPSFGFVVSDASGHPIFGMNPLISGISDIGDFTTQGSVRASVLSPTLLDGTYRLSVWLGDGKENFVEKRDCLVFDVTDTLGARGLPASSVGAVAAQCKWVFETEENGRRHSGALARRG